MGRLIIALLLILLFYIIINLQYIKNCFSNAQSAFAQNRGFLFTAESSKPSLSTSYQQNIPLILIQTNAVKQIDLNLYTCSQNNKHMNPEYEYLFFDDNACIDFIQSHFPDYLQWYNKLIPGAYKADLFRLLALKKLGGVYLDLKTTCLQPLRQTIPKDVDFMIFKDQQPGCVYNGIIACTPDHPVINQILERFIDNIKTSRYGINPLDIGGPQVFGRVLNTYFGRRELQNFPEQEMKKDGVLITGKWRIVKLGGSEIFLSEDESTPLFNRACVSYWKTKLKQAVKGKEYQSLWLLRKVYI